MDGGERRAGGGGGVAGGRGGAEEGVTLWAAFAAQGAGGKLPLHYELHKRRAGAVPGATQGCL